MELPSRIAKQNGEIVQAASGFNQCDVTLVPNGPVIIRLYEQRLFVCRKTQAMLRSFLDSFDFLFGTKDFWFWHMFSLSRRSRSRKSGRLSAQAGDHSGKLRFGLMRSSLTL